MLLTKTTISEYSEREFLKFLNEIYNANETETEATLDRMLDHLVSITEHPKGTDLLFWPEPGKTGSGEEVLKDVKEWCKENGKPGFQQAG